MTAAEFDKTVDVLVVGSGGGGMTAALTADAAGLDTLVVEKSAHFGGSTALSGGGIWVPGAPSQRKSGYVPDPDGVFEYLQTITEGLVSDARLRQYVDSAPAMMEFLEGRSRWLEFVWKPGYADYYPELPGGSELGSTINVPAIDLRRLGDEEQHLLRPLALAPKGIWFAPKDLRLFYQVRQNWRGKAVLLKLIWRMFRARVFGDRMAAIGQSLAARLRLAMKEHDVPLWLDSPMTELIADVDGTVVGAVVERDGRQQRIGARGGVILAAGGFDHDMEWRRQHLPVLEKDWSFGNPASMGDGVRTGGEGRRIDRPSRRGVVHPRHVLARRPPAVHAQRTDDARAVRCQRRRRALHQRGGALYGFRAAPMIKGQESGVAHIPCWLVTDIRSFHRYVVGGHIGVPEATAKAESVLATETKIATLHWAAAKRRERNLTYNPHTRATLEALEPSFPWAAFLDEAQLGEVDSFVVREVDAVAALAKLFGTISVAEWTSYLTYQFLAGHATVLPAAFDLERFEFYGRTSPGSSS